tara:strand:- start:11 stop:385 length:375 start_codon:yes stop_codon:yes gene_type:complete
MLTNSLTFESLRVNKGGNICIGVFDEEEEYDATIDPDYIPELVYGECLPATIPSVDLPLEVDKTYAIFAFHDENENGKLDLNPLKMPKEGFGFSNNPTLRRRPRWNQISFIHNNVNIVIKMNYL